MKTMREVLHNLTLLTETGYGEGEICHRLVNPTFSQADKQVYKMCSVSQMSARKGWELPTRAVSIGMGYKDTGLHTINDDFRNDCTKFV
jgi:hypothetical protein